jgi:transcriptional regulator with XRE-family HTH domain
MNEENQVESLNFILNGLLSKKKKLSQRGFASKLSTSSGYLSQVLSGRRVPSDEFLLKFCKVLELSDFIKSKILAAAQRQRLCGASSALALPLSSRLSSSLPVDCEINATKLIEENKGNLWGRVFSSFELVVALATIDLDSGPKTLEWFMSQFGNDRDNAIKILDLFETVGLIEWQSSESGQMIIKSNISKAKIFTNLPKNHLGDVLSSCISLQQKAAFKGHGELPMTAMAVPLNPSQLPELKAIFDEAFCKVLALGSKSKERTKVYCIQATSFDWSMVKNT